MCSGRRGRTRGCMRLGMCMSYLYLLCAVPLRVVAVMSRGAGELNDEGGEQGIVVFGSMGVGIKGGEGDKS